MTAGDQIIQFDEPVAKPTAEPVVEPESELMKVIPSSLSIGKNFSTFLDSNGKEISVDSGINAYAFSAVSAAQKLLNSNQRNANALGKQLIDKNLSLDNKEFDDFIKAIVVKGGQDDFNKIQKLTKDFDGKIVFIPRKKINKDGTYKLSDALIVEKSLLDTVSLLENKSYIINNIPNDASGTLEVVTSGKEVGKTDGSVGYYARNQKQLTEPTIEPTIEEVFPVDEVIEPETVAETFSDVLNNFSDIELIDYSASIIALGATLSPEVAKEIQTRFNSEYLYSTFWKQVSEKAAIITENTEQTPINFEDQVGNQDEVNLDIYNRGVDLFEDALLKLQESIFNKGEEHWNGIADKYIDAATRNARERGETAPVMEKQVIIKMLRQRNSMDRMNQMRQKLANAVYAGDESKVTQILNDNNFMLDRPFARRILTATTAFSESRQARNLANAPQYNKPEESFEQPTIIIEEEDVAPSNEQTLGVVLTGKDNQVAKNEVGILKSFGVNDNAIRTITGIDNETGVSHIPGLQIAYDYDQPISEEKTEGGNPVEGLGLKYITTARSDDTIIEVFQDAAGQLVYFKKRKIKSSVDDTDIIIPESGILANEDEGARMSVYLIDSTPLEESTIAKETFAGRHATIKGSLIGIQTLGLQFDGIAQNERQSVYEELLANLEKVIPSKLLYNLDDYNYRELQAFAKKEGIKATQSKENLKRQLNKLGYGIFGVNKELVINFTHINASVVNVSDEAIPDITVEQFYNIVRKEYLTMVSKRFKNNPIETIKNTGILNADRFESDEAILSFDEIIKENQSWNTTEVIFGATQEEIDGQWKDTLEFISNVLPNGEGFQIFNAIQDLVPEVNALLRRGKLVMRMWSQEQWDSFFAGKREPMAFIHWNGFGREIIVNPDVKPGFDRLQAALHELGHAIDFKYFTSTKGLVFNDGAKIWSDYVKKSLEEKGNDFDTRIRFVTTAGYKPNQYVSEYFAETWSHWVLIKSGLLPMIDDKTDIQFIDPESLEVMEEVMSNIGKIKDIETIRESRRSETQDFNEPLSTDKFEFSEPLPGIGMKNVFGIDEPRMQEVAKPIPVQKVLARADAIYFDYVTGLNLDELQLTDAEGEIAMRYLAQLQGIETGFDPVNVEDVPQSVIDLLETPQGWNTIFPEIADNLNEISETLNIPFKPIAGYYFPLRHSYSDSDVSAETIIDLIESSLGAVKQRKGKFEGVIKDPAEQLRRYLKDYSRLKAAAEAVQAQRESVRENYPSIAEGVVEAITSPKPTPNQEIKNQQVEDLREIEDFAETLGIPKTALTDFEFWRLVNQYEKDGQGQQLPSFEVFAQFMPESKVKEFIKEYGSDWANIVDPYMVVQTMDNLTDQLPQGRIYGSNSEVWERVVLAADRAKQIEVQNKEQQVEILRPIKRNKQNLNKLNDLLHNALIADKALVRMMFRDMPNASKISKILKVDLETASIVEWHRNKIVEYKKGLHLHEDMRSDLSLIDKELRSEFHQLYNAALEGVATEQEVLKLMTYAPDVKPGDDLSTEDGQKVELKRNIFRIASRWFFEREAINSGNFFSYFDSMSNMAIKGNMYTDVIALIDEWANYLESIGQNSNARWWRTKIKNNIKGDLFKFEDYVLDVVSTAVEIGAKKAAGKEFTGSGLDPIRAINAKDLKKNMVLAMNIIQKAAIARSLGGNLAWSLITQPSSLAFTIMKTGFMKTGQALYRVGRGKEGDIIDESAVASLKGFRKSGDGLFGSFEATGTWSDIGTRRGKRAILRDKLGLLQSGIESYLTSVSVVAGREYAKDTLGLTPDQSRIHGNFVGATTQTMYDQVTRNTALNSKFMRSSHPFQSYVFTAFSNGLDILGVLGMKRSAKQRFLIELGRWMVASNLWWLLWSLFFGDDLLKALFNPTIKKSTPGSFVPLFGKDLDIAISKAIPWMDDKSWQGDLPHEQFAKNTQKVFMNAVNNEENWERELAIYFNNYVFPFAGVPGAVPLNNFIKTYDARYNNYAYETAKGDVYRKMRTDGNTPWFGGVMFGIKGADEYTPFSFSNKFIKEK